VSEGPGLIRHTTSDWVRSPFSDTRPGFLYPKAEWLSGTVRKSPDSLFKGAGDPDVFL